MENIGGFLRPGTKYTRNFGQEVFGTYRDGPIESFDDIKSIKVVYDEYLDDVANMDFFYSISERYLFPSEDDFTGTIGDENEWIFENSPTVVCAGSISSPTKITTGPKPCTTNVWPISEMAKVAPGFSERKEP